MDWCLWWLGTGGRQGELGNADTRGKDQNRQMLDRGPSPLERAQGTADEGFDGGGGIIIEDFAQGFAGIDLFVA